MFERIIELELVRWSGFYRPKQIRYYALDANDVTGESESEIHSFAVARTNQKLPVVMFIHGGGYDWGSGNAYDGTLISSYANVVFVTINFRLGILGE